MKKLITVFMMMVITGANAAIQWWNQPTVCRISPDKCYTSMGIGYDAELWDPSGKCWGMKLICPDATSNGGRDAIAMERADIARGNGINVDFDTNVLNGDCYGARRTKNNGAQVSVGGNYVNVYCPGVLANAEEDVETGQIVINGAQPTCADLAPDGYVAVLNGKCYGKYYNTATYYIECGNAGALLPTRLIVLNGADYMAGTSSPQRQSDADAIFDAMYQVSSALHADHFGN